jgi:hypothetical protein
MFYKYFKMFRQMLCGQKALPGTAKKPFGAVQEKKHTWRGTGLKIRTSAEHPAKNFCENFIQLSSSIE